MTDPESSSSNKLGTVIVGKALRQDVEHICTLMRLYAAAQIVLPRDHQDVINHLDNFWVSRVNDTFAGCVAVRDFGNRLFEIRSLAVAPELTGHRIGSTMIKALVKHFASQTQPTRLFALTYRANFFINLGFSLVTKELFPEKIWSDCAQCPKQDHCDEDALLLELPGTDG